MSNPENKGAVGGGENRFPDTRWSLVLRVADDGETIHQREALEELCRIYYQPLIVFARCSGNDPEEAADLTQGFFAYLLQHDTFLKADPDKGRMRSFLLKCFKNYISTEWKKNQAAKRGSGEVAISIDEEWGDESGSGAYRIEPSTEESPDKLFDKQWALATLAQVARRLGNEYSKNGKGELFAELSGFLFEGAEAGSYEEKASALNMNEGALRTAAHRMRQRFRLLFRSEVADTVDDPAQVEEEIRYLRMALAS